MATRTFNCITINYASSEPRLNYMRYQSDKEVENNFGMIMFQNGRKNEFLTEKEILMFQNRNIMAMLFIFSNCPVQAIFFHFSPQGSAGQVQNFCGLFDIVVGIG